MQNNELLPESELPKFEISKISTKSMGTIQCYGANTHQGLVRNYNEDRVSIILNMMKPSSKQNSLIWPNCSFFAVYDGHGGYTCAEYLRDNLHYFIIRDDNFPQNPVLAIKKGFEKAEKQFIEKADSIHGLDKSGSCAIVSLIVDDMCYIANLGDSRAILSKQSGKKIIDLSEDHKPNNIKEEQRILSLGGKIYQSSIPIVINDSNDSNNFSQEIIKGPYRVLPGRLAVSRTLGDAEAKLPKYNGIPNVISAEPEIVSFQLSLEDDFLLLACDGVFDKMTNKEVIDQIWNQNNYASDLSIHDFVGQSILQIMKQTLIRKSFDNITLVIIGLSNLQLALNDKTKYDQAKFHYQYQNKNHIIKNFNLAQK